MRRAGGRQREVGGREEMWKNSNRELCVMKVRSLSYHTGCRKETSIFVTFM